MLGITDNSVSSITVARRVKALAMSSIGDRIRDARSARGISQTELSRRVGVSRASASQWESDQSIPTGPNMVTIARELKVRAEWLAEGKGPRDANENTFTPNVETSPYPITQVTVIGEVEAGFFRESLEMAPDEQFQIHIVTDPRYKGLPKIGLRVRGPSMNEIYPEGSCLICVPIIHLGPQYIPTSGQRVIVERHNPLNADEFDVTVKEIVYDDDNNAWLWPRSMHPEYQQPWKVPLNDTEDGDGRDMIRISALVIGSYRPEP